MDAPGVEPGSEKGSWAVVHARSRLRTGTQGADGCGSIKSAMSAPPPLGFRSENPRRYRCLCSLVCRGHQAPAVALGDGAERGDRVVVRLCFVVGLINEGSHQPSTRTAFVPAFPSKPFRAQKNYSGTSPGRRELGRPSTRNCAAPMAIRLYSRATRSPAWVSAAQVRRPP